MAGTPFQTLGPDTVEVSVPVAAGQGLEPDPANVGKFRPWGAGSRRCHGIARTQAVPAGTNALNNFAPVPRTTASQHIGDIRVVYAAPAEPMAPLMAAANGQVTPAPEGTAADLIVGKCSEHKGVTVAGATGRARITL